MLQKTLFEDLLGSRAAAALQGSQLPGARRRRVARSVGATCLGLENRQTCFGGPCGLSACGVTIRCLGGSALVSLVEWSRV